MTIATAVQQGSFVKVYDEKGSVIFTLHVGSGPDDGLKGYTSATVTIRNGGFIQVYNEKGSRISTLLAR